MPDVYKQLFAIQKKLERHYKNMQDIEFTIECGRLLSCKAEMGNAQHKRQSKSP